MYSKNIASFHSYEIEAILIFMIVHYIFESMKLFL